MSDDGPRFNVSEAPVGPASNVTLDNVLAAVSTMRGLQRIVICHEDHAETLEALVREEGLEHVVEVLGSRHIERNQAYIVKRSILAAPNVNIVQRWFAAPDGRHDVGEFNDGGPIRG